MLWKTIDRPGYFGKQRDEKISEYNILYGSDNWRLVWQWGDCILEFPKVCMIYEDGYFVDSQRRSNLWKQLAMAAKDVYDHDSSDVNSGLEYLIQNGHATHLQDIAIRRVMIRNGWQFSGDTIIQIRSHSEYWGKLFSPGMVSFHRPERIISPHLQAWWDQDSVEDFYQSNKLLQIREVK